jgi:polyphosphate kinase 2 (PPK2 family)
MGFCSESDVRGVLPFGAGVRAHAGALAASSLIKYWFSITDEEQHLPVPRVGSTIRSSSGS